MNSENEPRNPEIRCVYRELRDPATLVAHPRNPNRHGDRQIEMLARIIAHQGWRNPIVVSARSGFVVAGHGRLLAALKAGAVAVPVDVQEFVTEADEWAHLVADNRIAELAEMDQDGLGDLLRDLGGVEDFDLDLTGFDEGELAAMLAEPTTGETDPDEIPEPPLVPTSVPGDVWILGRHRLMCGDSAEPAQMARLMDGRQADLLLTDPPYNVAYEGGTKEAMTLANDDMDDAAYRAFLVATLGCAAEVLRDGGAFYCWHGDSEGLNVRGACADTGLKVRQCLIWVKSSMVMGRQDYQWRHEPCLYGWKKGAAHTWLADRSQTTVLEFDKPSRNGEHPTMKPVPLFSYLIQNSCAPGGMLLDPFGGSGTSLIAAEQTGRNARLMELDARYCDVIVRRWELFTGKKAVHAETGNGFDSPT
jgi:site-specific DNA-methyltransferase (adenine-specific)